VVIDRRQTLAQILATAEFANAPPPIETTTLDAGGRVYLVSPD
jgi:hypothetical protein